MNRVLGPRRGGGRKTKPMTGKESRRAIHPAKCGLNPQVAQGSCPSFPNNPTDF